MSDSYLPTRLISAFRLFAISITLFACAATPINLPAIGQQSSGIHDNGRVIWHDLLTPDPQSAQHFYGELFGWQFRSLAIRGDSQQNYTLIFHNGKAIGGMVDTTQLRKDIDLTQWVSVFSSGDIAASVATIKSQGGTIYTPPTSLGERGELAVVADAQGALFALLETRDGDPPEQKAAPGDFLWNELWTNSTKLASEFYRTLFDYEEDILPLNNGVNYGYFTKDQQPRAAVVKNPVPNLAPTWVTFVRVADPEAIVAKVPALGGEVLLDVQENPVGGKLAIIRDPSGAGLVIQTWEYKVETRS